MNAVHMKQGGFSCTSVVGRYVDFGGVIARSTCLNAPPLLGQRQQSTARDGD